MRERVRQPICNFSRRVSSQGCAINFQGAGRNPRFVIFEIENQWRRPLDHIGSYKAPHHFPRGTRVDNVRRASIRKSGFGHGQHICVEDRSKSRTPMQTHAFQIGRHSNRAKMAGEVKLACVKPQRIRAVASEIAVEHEQYVHEGSWGFSAYRDAKVHRVFYWRWHRRRNVPWEHIEWRDDDQSNQVGSARSLRLSRIFCCR